VDLSQPRSEMLLEWQWSVSRRKLFKSMWSWLHNQRKMY